MWHKRFQLRRHAASRMRTNAYEENGAPMSDRQLGVEIRQLAGLSSKLGLQKDEKSAPSAR
jgi:hypothetical protein